MSSGKLVLLDSQSRAVKWFPLADGLATLGRDLANDIRITLSSVAPHHASVVVRDNKTVIRAVGGTTLVNGRTVSVATLRHGDVISVAERSLRWEAAEPEETDSLSRSVDALDTLPARRGRTSRDVMRRSVPTPAHPARERTLQLAIEMSHRASMPGSTGGKQVAIVQPQRRNASEVTDKSAARSSPQSTSLLASTSRRNTSNQLLSTTLPETEDKSKRKSTSRTSPKNFLNTTKATLWIESRKTGTRRKVQTPPLAAITRRSLPHKKSTPLRLTVLRKAQSARKSRVIKIEAPSKIDHTKQAAIRLMTGHTHKSRISISPGNKSSGKISPSYVVKKLSPVRKTPGRNSRHFVRKSKEANDGIVVTPSRGSTFAQESYSRKSSQRNSGTQSVSVLEISDSTICASNVSTRSGRTTKKSPLLQSPKKSAMKDHTKKSIRKTESIKFDLSNLDSHQDLSSTNTTHSSRNSEDITLHYSDSSNHSEPPSPRRSIHSRSSRMLERVGKSLASPSRTQTSPSRTLTPESPTARTSIRSNAMVQKALGTSTLSDRTKTILSPDSSAISDRTRTILSANTTETSDRTKTVPSVNSTRASAFRTRTLSPRSNHNLESYSVIDLVSFGSQDASKSVYNSAGSENSTEFGTPPTTGRRTRSTIGPNLLGTSTPYVERTRKSRSKSSSNITNPRISAVSTRRSKSLTTPENKHISVNSTRISRGTKSRSRINDSDLMLDDTEAEESPKTSRRSRAKKSETNDKSVICSSTEMGISTPENRRSPEAASTPVLSIQSLLDSSRSSIGSRASARKSANYKRKTIGAISELKRRSNAKSLGAVVSSVRKTRLRLSQDSDRTDEGASQPDNDDTVTPRSAVKPRPEAVKDKHSTAKKPLSKRSIIDDLNRSDIVKQLFNSPVKRKLSQSITEFSRRQLFDDEDDIVKERHPKRRTVALTNRTLENSLLEPQSITPERFVSPVETPHNSPNLSRVKRLFKTTPSSSRKGGGDSPRATRSRASVKNDLTNVSGVKRVFAKSPRNDLRRVTGVKALVRHTAPKNDLTDVRGVRRMFQMKSPDNDLRNVSGVKRTLRTSPKNDLTDVRGVSLMFKSQKPATGSYHDLSGVEELFDSSARSGDRSEMLFDMLLGPQPVKAVYSKSFTSRTGRKSKGRNLTQPVEMTANNVNQWLEQELKRRLQAPASRNVTKELQKLSIDTVAGSEPIRGSRTRNSTFKSEKSASYIYNASMLPIKKRSLVEPSREVIKLQLPLKKRAVHSTPVKGRVEVTMNASELGRVSPIAIIHERQDSGQDCYVSRSTQTIDEDTEPVIQKKTRSPRKQGTPKKIDISKSTPQKSPERPKRATRNRKVSETKQMATKNRRTSLIVKKKAPAMVPQTSKADTNSTSSVELTKTRSKRTRAPRVSLIVGKPSPKIKSQRAARAANKSRPQEAIPKTKTARKGTTQKPESPKPSPQQKRKTRAKASKESMPKSRKILVEKPVRRGRNATVEVEKSLEPKKTRKAKGVESSDKEQSSNSQNSKTQNRRGRPAQTIEKQPKVRGKRAQNETEPEVEVKQTSRGRKAQNQKQPETEKEKYENTRPNSRGKKAQTQKIVQSDPEEKRMNTRGKKVQIQTSVQSEVEGKRNNTRGRKANAPTNTASEPEEKRSNTEITTESEPKTRRGQKAKPEESQRKTRGRKVEGSISAPEPITRGRRAKAEVAVVTETVSRKRKAPVTEEIPSKLAKPGAKSAAAEKSRGKQKRDVSGNNKADNSKQTSARASRSKPVEKIPARPRGRPAKEVKESVAASTSRGKRKANADPSPNKAAKKVAQRGVTSPTSSRQQRPGGAEVGRSRRR